MTILCVETSTSVCSAAVCKDGQPVGQCMCAEGANHARLLPRYVEQLLAEAKAQGLAIEAVALSEGPGSYTGLRIGTSMAKGLCYGLNVPLIPVPTLQVLAASAKAQSAALTAGSILCPMIDARRMEVYTALLDGTEEPAARAVVVENESSLLANGRERTARSRIVYFGDGAAKCQAVLSGPDWQYIPGIVPEAQYMGELVESRKMKDKRLTANELAYYEPFYLKEFVAAPSHVKGLN